ncbi:MAG: hypothetical protein AABZ15_06235 [Nitrospirota bacterium]
MGIMKMLVIAAILLCSPSSVFAGWSAPQEVLSGAWGTGEQLFGIVERYNMVEFPKGFVVDDEGSIIVADSVNRRAKVYTDKGRLRAIIKPQLEYEDIEQWPTSIIAAWNGKLFVDAGEHFQFYDYDGKLVSDFKVPDARFRMLLKDGSIIVVMVGTPRGFRRYTYSGKMLETYTDRPRELSFVERFNEEKSNIPEIWNRIIYSDKTYSIVEAGYFHRGYVRDKYDNLYDLYNPVYRFDKCGNPSAKVDLPQSQYEEIRPSRGDYGALSEAIAEYGNPFVSSMGDVYLWKRTPTTYSILKLTWSNEQNPGVSWQNEPRNLTASTTTSGIDLSWDTSLHDPGCVTEYEIGRAMQSGGPYTSIGRVAKGVLRYLDSSIPSRNMYFYAVRAVMHGEYSGYSNEAIGSAR